MAESGSGHREPASLDEGSEVGTADRPPLGQAVQRSLELDGIDLRGTRSVEGRHPESCRSPGGRSIEDLDPRRPDRRHGLRCSPGRGPRANCLHHVPGLEGGSPRSVRTETSAWAGCTLVRRGDGKWLDAVDRIARDRIDRRRRATTARGAVVAGDHAIPEEQQFAPRVRDRLPAPRRCGPAPPDLAPFVRHDIEVSSREPVIPLAQGERPGGDGERLVRRRSPTREELSREHAGQVRLDRQVADHVDPQGVGLARWNEMDDARQAGPAIRRGCLTVHGGEGERLRLRKGDRGGSSGDDRGQPPSIRRADHPERATVGRPVLVARCGHPEETRGRSELDPAVVDSVDPHPDRRLAGRRDRAPGVLHDRRRGRRRRRRRRGPRLSCGAILAAPTTREAESEGRHVGEQSPSGGIGTIGLWILSKHGRPTGSRRSRPEVLRILRLQDKGGTRP